MSKVVLSIPKLGVTERGWEHDKEIYVISFTSDLAKVSDAPKLPDVIAAYNETLPTLSPALMKSAIMQYVVMAVSNVFPRIRADQPVSLGGSGILLYPHLDPKGLLACHFMIVESDDATRRLGKVLQGIMSNKGISDAVGALIAAGITQPLLAGLMRSILTEVPAILQKNKDDLLFAHSFSGFDFDDYGLRAGENPSDYDLGNDRAFCTMRVRVTKQ